MKTWLMFGVLFSIISVKIQAQKVVTIQIGPTEQEMEKFYSETKLPFVATKKLFVRTGGGVKDDNIYKYARVYTKDQWQGLNVFVWEDLQCTKNQKFKQLVTLLILDKPLSGQVTLKDVEILAGGILNRHVLATYDISGKLIDQLDGAMFGESSLQGRPLWVKQFRVDPDMTVTIYELKADPKVPLNFWDQFESLNARRLDTKYRIDATGHFRKVSEVRYQPKTYSIAELTDPAKNIWDGTETVVE